MPRILDLNNRGDTIVEVLLAIAVVSAILGAAFVSINQSLQGTQLAQERGEALKLAEAQLELLKSENTNLNPGADQCLDENRQLTSTSCQQGPDGRYKIQLTKDGLTYKSTVTWDKPGGGERQVVEILYRTAVND